MSKFSNSLLTRIDDPAVREETARSFAQRGIIGHYIAGAYRTIGRPLAQWQIIQRARFLHFMWGMDAVANLIETLPTRYLNAVLRHFGATVADTAELGDSLRFTTVHGIGLSKLAIGQYVYFARRCLLDMSDEVSIGDYATLANQVQLLSHTDIGHSPLKEQIVPVKRGAVRIGRGAYLGSNAVIAQGVTIGEYSIVGASSFVDKSVPPFTFVGGVPAKVIGRIDPDAVQPFDAATAQVIPAGSTPDDFDYDAPDALKIPDNARVLHGVLEGDS